MKPFDPVTSHNTLMDVLSERRRQHETFGEQNLPDGTGPDMGVRYSDDPWSRHDEALEQTRLDFDLAARGVGGRVLTWRHVLAEEFWEAMCETDPAKLRAELVQVCAVACAWAEALDRKSRG